MNEQTLEAVFRRFALYGDLESFKSFGKGHINSTFLSTWNQAGTKVRYTHQRINKNVFKEPEKVIENIRSVTHHVYEKARMQKDDPIDASRRTLTLVPAKDGRFYYKDDEGEYWRTYLFIENASTFELMDNPVLAYKVGCAVGTFQKQLADYAEPTLHETIPAFHNMKSRYAQLDKAASDDKKRRLDSVREEFDFLQKNRERGMLLTDGLESGKLKKGITHNDTKLNNVLFDDATGEAICLIDLDTVMPGTVLFDTGDLIRTATNTGAEDERDLSKVGFNADLFRALIDGYTEKAAGFLTDYEKSLIAESGRILTQIMAVRFLTDYLNGDVYYKIERPSHNLDRARTQIKLIRSMDGQWDRIQNIVHDLCRKNTAHTGD